MKTKLASFLFGFLLTSIFSWAQVKVYAFNQPIIPGVKNTAIEEGGKEVHVPAKKRANLFFYLESKPGKEVKPTAIYYKGQGYKVKVMAVKTTPVQLTDAQVPGKTEKITLVPATKNKVVALAPDYDQHVTTKPSATLQKLLAANDVVFVYTCKKGKTHYKAVKKITELKPLATQ